MQIFFLSGDDFKLIGLFLITDYYEYSCGFFNVTNAIF